MEGFGEQLGASLQGSILHQHSEMGQLNIMATTPQQSWVVQVKSVEIQTKILF